MRFKDHSGCVGPPMHDLYSHLQLHGSRVWLHLIGRPSAVGAGSAVPHCCTRLEGEPRESVSKRVQERAGTVLGRVLGAIDRQARRTVRYPPTPAKPCLLQVAASRFKSLQVHTLYSALCMRLAAAAWH